MENNQIQANSLFDKINQWIRESIMVKMTSIGVLILLLLIPSAGIQDLIDERQNRAEEVVKEIAAKWSGNQILAGPVLVLPYRHTELVISASNTPEEKVTIKKAYFLPELLEISGEINPEVLHRGIFDAIVYEASIRISAEFNKPDLDKLEINKKNVVWSEAHLVYSMTDLRGISKNGPSVTLGGKDLPVEPTQKTGIHTRKNYPDEPSNHRQTESNPALSETGIRAMLNWESEADFIASSSIKFDIKGSEGLSFVPLGKSTSVKLTGDWSDPSFVGGYLPAFRNIENGKFSAEWNVLHFNRPFSQEWKDNESSVTGSEFGLRLVIPVDQYQKSMRTAKYGMLIILLTFISLFLVEVTRKIQIHPFQYILVGVALIIYSSLLLSLSEHLGYNISYWISTSATVMIISLYANTFLKDLRLTLILSGFLSIFYAFIFIIILQQDYSLLIGSMGLLLILGTIMYFSRKVNWYN